MLHIGGSTGRKTPDLAINGEIKGEIVRAKNGAMSKLVSIMQHKPRFCVAIEQCIVLSLTQLLLLLLLTTTLHYFMSSI